MSEDDRYRIESRLRQQGRGLAPTPEDIEELRERQRQADKLLAKPPERAFDAYLGERDQKSPEDDADGGTEGEGPGDERGAEPNEGPQRAESSGSSAAGLTQQVSPPPVAPGAAQRAHQAGALQALLNQRLSERKEAQTPAPRPSFFASAGRGDKKTR